MKRCILEAFVYLGWIMHYFLWLYRRFFGVVGRIDLHLAFEGSLRLIRMEGGMAGDTRYDGHDLNLHTMHS